MFSKAGLILFILSLVIFIASVVGGMGISVLVSIILLVMGGTIFIVFDNEEDDAEG